MTSHRRAYGHPNGPDAPPTTSEVFEQYADDAVQFALDQMTDDGLDSPLILWMEADPERDETLAETFASFAHAAMIRRGDKRAAAIDEMIAGMRYWAEKYVQAWDNTRKSDYIDDQYRRQSLAKSMDREEGNDE